MLKKRIAFFGNCQADQLQRILGDYGPLIERFELVHIRPVYMMTGMERQAFLDDVVPTIDILVSQHIGDAYAPATTLNIQKRLPPDARVFFFPSIWFDALLPDIFWMHPPPGITVAKAPASYHSRLIAYGFSAGLSESATAQLFTLSGTFHGGFLDENLLQNIRALKEREKSCDLFCIDRIVERLSFQPVMHTMNHPDISVLFWLIEQLMAILAVEAPPDSLRLRYNHALAEIKWPIAKSVAEHFKINYRKEELILGGISVPLAKFIAMYFDYYQTQADLIAAHKADLQRWHDRAVGQGG